KRATGSQPARRETGKSLRKPADCLFRNYFLFQESTMPIFMKYEGIDKGSSTTKGHLGSDGWTELNSVQWGVGRGITDASQGAEREASAPSVSEITVTKLLDLASYRLFEEGLTGDGKTVTIHFTKTNKDQQDTYMEYILSNTLVSGFSTNCSG